MEQDTPPISRGSSAVVAPDHGELLDHNKFCLRHASSPHLQSDTFYAMPTPLLEVVQAKLPGWLSPKDVAFEQDLARLCETHQIVGIVDDQFIGFPLLTDREITLERDLAPSFVSWVKQVYPDKTEDQVRSMLLEGFGRKSAPDDQNRAYLGWLLSNPQFAAEWEALRASCREQGLSAVFQPGIDPEAHRQLKEVLDRWNLAGAASWELPIPQGPNLSKAPWPKSVTDRPGMINFTIPSTLMLNSELSLDEYVKERQRENCPEHLQGWYAIMDRQSDGQALTFHQNLFRVQFYFHTVLQSRYGERMQGKIGKLDEALGEFLCLSPSGVKTARLHINQSLSGGHDRG